MIELISVHIPKTAGNSFMKVLKRHYGRRLLRLYHDFRPGVDYQKKVLAHPRALALHGHFPLEPFTDAFPQARTVVWLRHPVARLVSYYYYWLKLRPHGNANHDRFMAGDRSIAGLAEMLRGEVSGYLGGTRLEDIGFVGIVEHFDEDIARFGAWLDRGSAPPRPPGKPLLGRLPGGRRMPHANRNRRKGTITPQVRAELEAILADEMALYHAALERRATELAGRLAP